MAVSIDGFCLVARVSALAERFPGGVRGFLDLGNPVRSCSDGKLARVAFMDRNELARLGAELDALGLGPSAERPADWVCVGAARGVDAGCRWIEFGRYGGMPAAWLRGTDPEPLVIPPAWTPRYQLDNQVDASKLRFVSREDGVETWEHIETGQKHYIARDRPEPREPDRHQARYEEAVAAIKPFIEISRKPTLLQRLMLKWWSLPKLERVIAEDPERADAQWYLGVGRRAVGQREAAYVALRHAYLLQPENLSVCREYVLQCMATERAKEAVTVAERISRRYPDDVGLFSNFGLTLLVAGDVERALAVAREAHEREPDDAVTRALLKLIEDVAAGRRPRPTRYPP